MPPVLGMRGRVPLDDRFLCPSLPPGLLWIHCPAYNAWLITHLPDRFAAGVPDYDPTQGGWRIPVWLSYPGLEPLGPVGELLVDAVSGDVRTHPSIADMKARALQLYEHRRAQIEVPLL